MVGRVCAEKLTDDYLGPLAAEKRLKRKARWMAAKWKRLNNNTWYRSYKGTKVLILEQKSMLCIKIGSASGSKIYPSFEDAVSAAFDGLEWYRTHKHRVKAPR